MNWLDALGKRHTTRRNKDPKQRIGGVRANGWWTKPTKYKDYGRPPTYLVEHAG